MTKLKQKPMRRRGIASADACSKLVLSRTVRLGSFVFLAFVVIPLCKLLYGFEIVWSPHHYFGQHSIIFQHGGKEGNESLPTTNFFNTTQSLEGGGKEVLVSATPNASKIVKILPKSADLETTKACNDTINSSSLCQFRPRNVNIVMIGDSLMRYQYLSLAYFLRWGHWFDPRISEGNLVNHLSWGNFSVENPNSVKGHWNAFFWHTNQLLYPYEICDCYRENNSVRKEHIQRISENRYFYDPILNNTVIYILAFGHRSTLHGRISDPTQIWNTNMNSSTSWQAHQSLVGTFTPHNWTFVEWHDVVRHHIAPLRPKYFVFNAGWWMNKFGDDPNRDLSLKQAVDDLGNGTSVGIWSTTTYPSEGHHRKHKMDVVDGKMCRLFNWCLDLSWTRHVPYNMSFDGLHFLEPVYRVMNEVMLQRMEYMPPRNDQTSSILGAELQRVQTLLQQYS